MPPVRSFAAAAVGFAALGFAAILGLGACSSGSSANVDTSGIIQPVTARLNDLGVRVTGIECPTGIAAEAGSTFSCTVATEGGTPVDLRVTQVPEGSQVKLSWQLGPEVVPTGPLLPDLSLYARDAVSAELQVSCPRAVVAAGGSGVLACDVTDAAGTAATLEVPVVAGAPVGDRAQWSIVQSADP